MESAGPSDRRVILRSVVTELVGGVGQRIGHRREFPDVLNNPPYLPFVVLALRITQKWHHVIDAERDFLNVIHFHDVKTQLGHFKFQLVLVTADDALQGWCKGQLGCKPHTAFLMGGQSSVLQEIEKGRNLGFQLLQKVGIIAVKTFYLPNPISGFSHIYDDGEQLVVGA